MRHTIPWSVKGVDQDAREAAKEAARRAGMSLGEWLNAAIVDQAGDAEQHHADTGLSTVTRRLDTIAQRLDAVTRRGSETAIPHATIARTEHGEIVRALDAVARLAEISERRSAAAIEAVERLGSSRSILSQPPVSHAAQAPVAASRSDTQVQLDEIARSIRGLDAPTAPVAPAPRPAPPARIRTFHHDIDATVAEIAARQRALGSGAPAPAAPPVPTAITPVAPAPDRDLAPIAAKLDGLSRQLDAILNQPAPRQASPDRAAIVGEISKLSERIDAINRPTDDGLERELRTLSSRIEQMRKDMAAREADHDDRAIADLRADIAAIGEQLVDLAPRRAVESLETELHAIADRLDDARAQGLSAEPLQKIVSEFERTIARLMPAEGIADELKAISFRLDTVASKGVDTGLIQRLTDETSAIRAMLADTVTREAVDVLAEQIGALGRRIDDLAVPRAVDGAEALASAIEARIDEIATRLETASRAATPAPAAATSPELEDALRRLADKLDASHGRPSDPSAMAEIERHILTLAAKIDASDARFTQLGTIERGLSDLFVQMEEMRSSAIEAAERAARSAVAREVEIGRREAEPAASAARRPQETVEAVQNTLERVVKRIAEIEAPPSAPDIAPPAELPRAATLAVPAPVVAERAAAPVSRQSAPSRPPGSIDMPLEPGSGAPRLRPPAPGAATTGGTKADFIAAARRAAQAAASEPVIRSEAAEPEKPSLMGRLRGAMRRSPQTEAPAETPAVRQPRKEKAQPAPTPSPAAAIAQAAPEILIEPSVEPHRTDEEPASGLRAKLAANRKTIVMGIAAALLVLAAGLSSLPKLRNLSTPPETTNSATVAPQSKIETEQAPVVADRPREVPTTTFTPASSNSTPVDLTAPPPAGTDAAPAAAPSDTTAPETTGSVTAPRAAPPSGSTVSPTGWQPVDTRTGRAVAIPAALKTAAEAGDPAAAYEMGTRHLEGRGVAVSAAEAAKWYQRAADAGIAPAQYRLGSLYEKGTGVMRDFQRARRLYERAAEAGNGKAMHNLAVMFAQGQASERPDYKTAAQWFRRAADYGVTDSQYNLGILYARGLGVDQSLAEAYKWFALSAAGGDQDAGKKRDEVAGRLDAQTLVAARLAVQTFTAKPEPENAVRVAAPADGWGDAPAAQSAPAQPTRQPARRAQTTAR